MASLERHPYEPLTGPSQIRIVKLFPKDETIISTEKPDTVDKKTYMKCQLYPISLDKANLTSHTIYYALSYTWGIDPPHNDILLDGKKFKVANNLFNFLQSWRTTLNLLCSALPHTLFLNQFALYRILLLLPQQWPAWLEDRRHESLVNDVLPAASRSILSSAKFDDKMGDLLRKSWTLNDLKDLREHPQCYMSLWVDAICIDQMNDKEKSSQIPLMTRIYSSAAIVPVWLGDESVIRKNDLQKLDDIIETLTTMAKGITLDEVDQLVPAMEEMGVDIEEGSKILAHVFRKCKWFTRMWVIQEMAVARVDPLLYIGHYKFQWGYLFYTAGFFIKAIEKKHGQHNASELLSKAYYNVLKLNKSREDVQARRRGRTGIGGPQSGTNMNTEIAKTMYGLIKATMRSFACGTPHDRVYALLGLATNSLETPKCLEVNYEKSVGDVFRQYAIFLMKNTGDLTILTRSPYGIKEKLTGQPSWTPDWQNMALEFKTPQAAVSDGVEVLMNGTELKLKGVKIGTVVSCRQEGGDFDVASAFFSGGDPSKDVGDQTREQLTEEFERLELEQSAMYRQLEETGEASYNSDLFARVSELGMMLKEKRPNEMLASLDNGREVSLPKVMEPLEGVIVCMLVGAHEPSLLSPVGNDTYRFITSCETDEPRVHDPTKEWYKQQELQTYVLV